MAILSPNMEKKDILTFVKKVQNGDKNSKLERYTYMGEQIVNMSLVDATNMATKNELASNLTDTQENAAQSKVYSSVLSGLFGDISFSREDVIAIRDVLVAPFVSDIYGGGSEEESNSDKVNNVDILINDLITNNQDILYTRLAKVTQEIENMLKKFPVEEGAK